MPPSAQFHLESSGFHYWLGDFCRNWYLWGYYTSSQLCGNTRSPCREASPWRPLWREGNWLSWVKKKNSAAKFRPCRRKDEVYVRGEVGAGRTIGHPGGFQRHTSEPRQCKPAYRLWDRSAGHRPAGARSCLSRNESSQPTSKTRCSLRH